MCYSCCSETTLGDLYLLVGDGVSVSRAQDISSGKLGFCNWLVRLILMTDTYMPTILDRPLHYYTTQFNVNAYYVTVVCP